MAMWYEGRLLVTMDCIMCKCVVAQCHCRREIKWRRTAHPSCTMSHVNFFVLSPCISLTSDALNIWVA